MKYRCTNPNAKCYARYGGRGIRVCDTWMVSFKSFYDWAMANGYERGLTIDRIDNNGNYEPTNCRWATYKVQGNNHRGNTILEYKGEKKTGAQWAEIFNMRRCVLSHRINKLGWSVEKALETKVKTFRQTPVSKRKVIDISTGIVYNSLHHACTALHLKYSTVMHYFHPGHKNPSSLRKCSTIN